MASINQKVKEVKTSDGSNNLHDHLKKVIAELALSKKGVDSFEAASFKLGQKPRPEIVFKIREAYAHVQDYEKKTRELAGKINVGTQEQPQEPASLGYVPDLTEESRAFEKFGIGFGESESFLIFKSLCRFAQKKNAKQIRLWGKILGSEKDYYVAEGVADTVDAQGELPPDVQSKGNGVNKTLFWVTNELTGEWTELPIVTPQQIQISRRVKNFFSGDLNRKILSNPDFPGTQSHLLKCQLTRIHNACSIIPKGMYTVNAEDPKEIQSPEQYSFPDVNTLSEKSNWVYFNPSILKNGRTTLLKPEGLEPEDEEKWVKEHTAKDPSEPRLKNIALDNQNWSLKAVDLQETYLGIGKNAKPESKGVVGLKNLIWPGWLTVAYGGKHQSLYIGYGHKAKQCYYPCEPETVLEQNEDKEEVVIDE